jgi:LuxR family maltose regulon positive regulatory protein
MHWGRPVLLNAVACQLPSRVVPAVLAYIAEALDAVEPIDERVFDVLASPVSSVPGSVVPRLGSALSAMTSPVALVLDDVHALHNSECRAALSVLADHVPGGSRLALAGRAGPPLRTARLRAEGRILEIGPEDLSLTPDEASSLLRNADVVLGEDIWPGRTCCWCRWTGGASGTATTTCSATCSWPS